MRVLAALVILVLLSAALSQQASAAPVLERVVMVTRHGVRAPTRTAEVLASLTKRGWPVWPEGAGEMTRHGAKALGLMADYLRETYRRDGLLPATGCPPTGTVEVWADALDHRTRVSGDIIADHLAPGCGVVSHSAKDTAPDPLFDASKTDACPIGLLTRAGALFAATGQKDGLLRPQDREALERLQAILAPDACTSGNGLCLISRGGASTAHNGAALTLGAMVAEALYLEYVDGRPLADVGWGKVADAESIKAIMPIHERGIDVLRRTPALAARRGAVLTSTILALLQGHPLPVDAPRLSRNAKLIMLAGHDSNLLYLAALMGLDWRFPGQPTMTPPDATLAFEVWREPATDHRTIRVVIYAQTLAQLREATPLDAAHKPDVVPIVPDACAGVGGDCELDTFAATISKQTQALCRK